MNIFKKSEIEQIIKQYPLGLNINVKYSDFQIDVTKVTGYEIVVGEYYLITEPIGKISVERLRRGL